MIRLKADDASKSIHTLFDGKDMPAGLRCRGVLTGFFPGEIFTDDLQQPTWAIVRETVYGTLYPQGAVTKPILKQLVDNLQSSGDVLIGYWSNDALAHILPDAPQYEGAVFDCSDLVMPDNGAALLNHMPPDCSIHVLDEALMPQSPWYQDRLDTYGSLDAMLSQEIGFGLVREGILVSEATAAPIAAGVYEIGTITHPDHRGQGFATMVCVSLLKDCVSRGLQTYWNCNKENVASVALARKLGYRSQREYRLVGWFPPTE